MGYNAEQSVENQPVFRSNMSPPSSGLKSKPNKKPAPRRQQAEHFSNHCFIGLICLCENPLVDTVSEVHANHTEMTLDNCHSRVTNNYNLFS
jgi:hypothetical protein